MAAAASATDSASRMPSGASLGRSRTLLSVRRSLYCLMLLVVTRWTVVVACEQSDLLMSTISGDYMREKSYGVEIKILVSLVNLIPKARAVPAVAATDPQAAEALFARAATIVGAMNSSRARPARRAGRATTLTLTLGGQSFTFSPAGHLHPAGHAILFGSFLTHCRGALLALASKTFEANGLRLEQYYPVIAAAPVEGASSLTGMMPTERKSELSSSYISVPAPAARTMLVGVDGRISDGNDPFHDGFIALLLKCDARRIRVCEDCLGLFYARTLAQRGCCRDHCNRISQRILRRRERGEVYKEARRKRAKSRAGR